MVLNVETSIAVIAQDLVDLATEERIKESKVKPEQQLILLSNRCFVIELLQIINDADLNKSIMIKDNQYASGELLNILTFYLYTSLNQFLANSFEFSDLDDIRETVSSQSNIFRNQVLEEYQDFFKTSKTDQLVKNLEIIGHSLREEIISWLENKVLGQLEFLKINLNGLDRNFVDSLKKLVEIHISELRIPDLDESKLKPLAEYKLNPYLVYEDLMEVIKNMLSIYNEKEVLADKIGTIFSTLSEELKYLIALDKYLEGILQEKGTLPATIS